jgi:hypothetical protein
MAATTGDLVYVGDGRRLVVGIGGSAGIPYGELAHDVGGERYLVVDGPGLPRRGGQPRPEGNR